MIRVKIIIRFVWISLACTFWVLADAGVCDATLVKNLPDVRVVNATQIESQPFWEAPRGVSGRIPKVAVPFCRIEGVIEKEIAFELWLPLQKTWNGRYLGTGNGGDAGFINYDDLARGVQRSFAVASTDTGHSRTEARWALHHPERVENFGYRAHHLLAERSKSMIDAYYGKRAAHSYFIGCSGGGSQGMVEAHRYPNDYDGIISGASGNGMLPLATRILVTALYQESHPEYALSVAQWSAVHAATVKACDAQDGIADGIVDDPARCSFDPAVLACGKAAAADCLTAEQIKTVREAYSPLKDATGVALDPGFPPGAEYRPVPRQIGTAGLLFGDWTYQNEAWNPRTFDLARDVSQAGKKFWFLMFPEPDFRAFNSRGGKLLSYHGAMDEIVPPGLTIGIHEFARNTFKERTGDFYRLFVVPGMQHCSRGEAPNEFGQAFAIDPPQVDAEHDALTAIVDWVEKGKAPNQLIASRVIDGRVTMTRPLCPYPQRARYVGTGSTSEAKNFVCR
jgi:feruloyl esterase